jgi:uncharacterized protein (TIGR01777 family)
MLVSKGHQVIILTRTPRNQEGNSAIRYAAWDPGKQVIDVKAVQSADYIIHLAGAPVIEKRWTASYKKNILESRTKTAGLIINTLKNNPHQVKALISASAIGWYGPDKHPVKAFTETDPPNGDFLGTTCKEWEESVEAATETGIRVCKLRTGIVLAKEGGAMAEFIKPIRFGIAAILSSGKQVVSWIHVDDLCRMFLYAIENNFMAGSYNAVAPVPVSNKTLTITLAKAIRGQFYIPVHVPSVILKLMMGQRSIELLKSTTVSAEKISQSGFTFLYPSIESSVAQLLSSNIRS